MTREQEARPTPTPRPAVIPSETVKATQPDERTPITHADAERIERSYDPAERRRRSKNEFNLNQPDAGFLGNRIPPNDLEAERIVLSAAMQSPEAARTGFKMLTSEDFYHTAHRAFFEILRTIFNAGRYFDVFTAKKEAEAAGILEELGGDVGFLDLMNAAPNSAMMDEYAAIVRQKAIQRAVVAISTQLLTAAYDTATPLDELVNLTRNAASAVRQHKPEILTIREMMDAYPEENQPVIEGLLRRKETANLIAPSKIGKSHLVMMLTYAIVTGGKFLGRQCTKGKVLIIDNELNPPTTVARNKSLHKYNPDTLAGIDDISVWSLRGNLQGVTEVCQRDLSGYDVIILDAWYRFQDGDENNNADVTRIYNQLDQMAGKTNAALIAIHHMSKGNQSDKAVIDAGAGAGAQSRAADTHIIIREHEGENCYVMEAAVRSFPPVEPVVIQKEYPIFVLRGDLDPTKLAGRKKTPENDRETAIEAILRLIPLQPEGITKDDLIIESGFAMRTLEGILPILERTKRIESRRATLTTPKIYYRKLPEKDGKNE